MYTKYPRQTATLQPRNWVKRLAGLRFLSIVLGGVILLGTLGVQLTLHISARAAASSLTANPIAAVTYADQHWQWTKYDGSSGEYCNNKNCSYGSIAPSGDLQPQFACAEFIARALAAEGLLPGLSPTDPPSHYGSYQGYDLLWTAFSDGRKNLGVYDYLIKNGLGVDIGNNPSAASAGDVVFYGGPGYSHAALLIAGGPNASIDSHDVAYFHKPYFWGPLPLTIVHIKVPTSQGLVFTNAHTPVTARDADGRVEVFAVGQDSQLWHNYETNLNGNWSGWQSMGGNWPGDPAVALNNNGTLEVFIVGNQGPNGASLFHAWQTGAGSNTWTGWNAMNGVWPKGIPSVVHNLASGLEVFMRGRDANLYHAWQCGGCSNGWSNWYPMGGSWNTDPVVANSSNGGMEIFMVGGSTNLYYNQESSSGAWSGWVNMGGTWPVERPTITTNMANRLEVFMRGWNSNIYHAWQTSPNSGTWTGWYAMGASVTHNPVVAKNTDGRMELFVVGNNNSLYRQWENSQAAWSRWNNTGGSWSGQPAVTINLAGGLEVFMVGYSGQIYHAWQNGGGNSGSYSNWYSLT